MAAESRLNAGGAGVVSAGMFGAAYTAAAAVAAIRTGNGEFIFYIVVMIVLTAAIFAIHWRIGLSTGLIWMLAIWGILHMAGGLVPVPESWPINGEVRVLYSWWIIPKDGGGGWLKFDQIVHAYGFATATWLCWQCLCGAVRPYVVPLQPTFGLMVLMVAAGCGLGAMNEVVEFVATLIAKTNVGGYENTGWDLVSNLTGSIIAATAIAMRGRAAGDRAT